MRRKREAMAAASSYRPAGGGLFSCAGQVDGYPGKVAEKIVAREALFRLAVPRSKPLWRAVAAVHEDDWTGAVDYPDAQVAMLD